MIDYTRSSPHHDNRPDNTLIKLLVIHNISLPPNSFSGPWIDDLFLGRLDSEAHPYFKPLENVKVSAHLLIRRTGEVIQYVPYEKRAWHAGVSSWNGENNCNDFSIGIELEGADDLAYTSSQYDKLRDVVDDIIKKYPLISVKRSETTMNSICGHCDIAPERKTDPGKMFDWDQLYCLLANE